MTLVKITVIQMLCFFDHQEVLSPTCSGTLTQGDKDISSRTGSKVFFFLAAFWGDATREINKTRKKLFVSNPIHINANSSTSMYCNAPASPADTLTIKLNQLIFVAIVNQFAELKNKASNTLNLNILGTHFSSKSIEFFAHKPIICVLS